MPRMTIDNVIHEAQKRGLICEDRNNIPTLINPDVTEAEFHKFFKEIGWERSYGCIGNLKEGKKRERKKK